MMLGPTVDVTDSQFALGLIGESVNNYHSIAALYTTTVDIPYGADFSETAWNELSDTDTRSNAGSYLVRSVPEPPSLLIVGLGLVSLWFLRKQKAQQVG